MSFSDDDFDDEFLAQIDAIEAAHVLQMRSAQPTALAPAPTSMQDDIDLSFDYDDSYLDEIDPPAPTLVPASQPVASTSAQPPATQRPPVRTTSQTVQTTLTGEPFNSAGPIHKPRAMPKAGKFSKTKKWDHTAFAKTGRRASKKKDSNDVGEENIEFEQFPSPFVPGRLPMKPAVDRLSARQWIFPLNREKREYQHAIAEAALFENTLVALPTGLGKTFIAGVVMLNYYLWFPTGKVIFVAPTKPLVAQQIVACHEVCGIPGQAAAEMHGEIKATKRAQLWEQKRVFYMTPQTLQNDITSENFDIRDVVLLVIDEAHRATGEYAYCTVIRHLMSKNPYFRVLALTATPSSDKDKIQPIVDALHISHIEIRSESSPDIVPYIKKKVLTKHIIEIPPRLGKLRDGLAKVMLPMIKGLTGGELYGTQDPVFLKPYTCKAAIDRLQGRKVNGYVIPMLSNLRNLATTMGYLLEFSPRLALDHIEGRNLTADPSKPPRKPAYKERKEYKELLSEFRLAEQNSLLIHPKMEKLRDLLVDYFVKAIEDGENSKAMVFVSFRSCVEEIVQYLQQDHPLIRATKFIGQGDDKTGKKGLSQKEQLSIIERFKQNEFNVLISTSIGEEGLDIGEVDLIICYETTSSAIRSLQRAGRTGRKRDGRLELLMTEGREEANWDKSTEKYEDVQYAIRMAQLDLYCDVERLIPPDITPTCTERPMEIEPYSRDSKTFTRDDDAPPKKGSKKKKDPQRNIPEGTADGFIVASQLVTKGKKRKKDENDENDENETSNSKRPRKAKKSEEDKLTFSQVMAELDEDDEDPQLRKRSKPKGRGTASSKKSQQPHELSYDEVMAEAELSGPSPPVQHKAKGKARSSSSTTSRPTSRISSRSACVRPFSVEDHSIVDLCDSPIPSIPAPSAATQNWILSDGSDIEVLPADVEITPAKPALAFRSARDIPRNFDAGVNMDTDAEVIVSTPARRRPPFSPSSRENVPLDISPTSPMFPKHSARAQFSRVISSPDVLTQAVRAPGQAPRRVRTISDFVEEQPAAQPTSRSRLQRFKCPPIQKTEIILVDSPPIATTTRTSPSHAAVKRTLVRADPVRRAARNELLDTLAEHSGDDADAGDTSASDMEEDEEDRQFVTELDATQVDSDYDQSQVYRRSLFTQVPGASSGPTFHRGPRRTNSHLNAREWAGRKRAAGVSSSPPPDPDRVPSDYEEDSFLVGDDEPILPLSSDV